MRSIRATSDFWTASLVLGSLGAVANSSAQAPLVRHEGGHPVSSFGNACDVVGDVDLDGVADYAVAAYRQNVDPYPEAGRVVVYSGASFGEIASFAGVGKSWLGFSLAAAGDIDGDGRPDVIVGAIEQEIGGNLGGFVRIASGLDGSTVLTLVGDALGQQTGSSVDGIGDVDNDGFPDVIVGARFASVGSLAKAGRARVHSGATGAILRQFDGFEADQWLGWSVAAAGDVDADGVADALVGLPGANTQVFAKAGRVRLFSGATGFLLKQFDGASSNDAFGATVEGELDIDGDAIPDLLIGAPNDDTIGFHSGAVRIFSGATYSPIATLRGNDEFSSYGRSIARVGDLDLDGRGDFAVGAPDDDFAATSAGALRTYSATGLAPIETYYGYATNDRLGSSVAGALDLNGDGRMEILVGGEQSLGFPGFLEVWSSDCGSNRVEGSACAGSGGFAPSLAVGGCFTPKAPITFVIEGALGTISGGSPNLGMLLFGTGAVEIAIGADCSLLLSGILPFGLPVTISGDGDGQGAGAIVSALPGNAIGPWELRVQGFCADPTRPIGFTTTQAVRFGTP